MKRWLEEWGSTYTSLELDDGMPSKALVLEGYKPDGLFNDEILRNAKEQAVVVLNRGQWPELWFGKGGEGRPNRKTYQERVKKGVVPMTYWVDDDYSIPEVLGSTSWEHEQSGHSQTGVKELEAVVGKGHGFDTVKPLKLIEKIIQLW